eukprot:756536-Hanusia_phi.AAC.2
MACSWSQVIGYDGYQSKLQLIVCDDPSAILAYKAKTAIRVVEIKAEEMPMNKVRDIPFRFCLLSSSSPSLMLLPLLASPSPLHAVSLPPLLFVLVSQLHRLADNIVYTLFSSP